MRSKLFYNAACFLILAACAAQAQAPREPAPPNPAVEKLDDAGQQALVMMAPLAARPPYGWTLGQIRDQLLQQFRAASADGRNITVEDQAFPKKQQRAQLRAQLLQQFLAIDVDNVGRVTVADIRRHARSNQVGPMPPEPSDEQLLARFPLVAADTDGDGVVTWREATAWAETRAATQIFGVQPPGVTAAAFDRDGDGVITLEEFVRVVDAVYKSADLDGDGALSQAESAAMGQASQTFARAANQRARRDMERERIRAQASICKAPQIDRAATYVAVEAAFVRGLPNVTLGGAEARVAEVNIEEGEGALVLTLGATGPTIWSLTGATSRVTSAFVYEVGAPGHPAGAQTPVKPPRAGVAGAPADKVSFAAAQDCLPMLGGRQEGPSRSAPDFEAAFGRVPDVSVTHPNLGVVHMPSGVVEKTPRFTGRVALPSDGPGADLWRKAGSTPIVSIDPAAVVSPLKVERAKALPGLAGLAALVDAGALKVTRYETGVRVGDEGPLIIGGGNVIVGPNVGQLERVRDPSEFLILEKVKLPQNVAHMRFVLARGVEPPDGDLSKLCIVAEETNTPIAGAKSCR